MDGRIARRRGPGAGRSQRAEHAGHDDTVGDRGQRRRRARRLRDQRCRLRLAHVDRSERGHGRGAARSHPVEQVHARGVDQGRRRLLLLPLPGAAGRCGLRRPEPRHGAALPPDGHRSGGRRRRVLDPARTGVAVRRRGLRGRRAPRRHDRAGDRPRDAHLRRRSRRRRRSGDRATAPRGGRRPLRARRDHRPARDPADQPRGAAQPRHRGGRGRSLADRRAHPGGGRRPGARRAGRGPACLPLPPRRPPPARDLRARRAGS